MAQYVIFGDTSFAERIQEYITLENLDKVICFTNEQFFITRDEINGIPVVPFERLSELYDKGSFEVLICIGYTQMNQLREKIYHLCKNKGYKIGTWISKSAIIYSENIEDNFYIVSEEDVIIYISNNHIVFDFNNTTVVSRLIEGEYFKIDQMLSSDYETKVKINKKELLSCIDRATLLVKEGDKKPIIINIGDEIMELKIKSQLGSMNEEIFITKEGKDLLIGFNPKFLIDALRVIDDEEVTLYLMNPKAPCFIKDENETYIYLILPVNFNAGA